MPSPLVVQKFGGSSVAGADRIKRVARRISRERAAGHDLVVVVSAMGDTTDELLGLAAGITPEPDPRALWSLVLQLPRTQRATVVLRYYECLSVAETAAVLDCSTGTVKSNCSRGLATLRRLVEETPDAAPLAG